MDIDQIEEIKSSDFYLVVDIINESKLIDEQLLDLENAISFLKCKLDRNKAKIFVKKENGIPIAFMVLYHKVKRQLVGYFQVHRPGLHWKLCQ